MHYLRNLKERNIIVKIKIKNRRATFNIFLKKNKLEERTKGISIHKKRMNILEVLYCGLNTTAVERNIEDDPKEMNCYTVIEARTQEHKPCSGG